MNKFDPEEELKKSTKPIREATKYGIGYLADEVGGTPGSKKAGKVFKKVVDVLGLTSRK